jgi:hypothetical protein
VVVVHLSSAELWPSAVALQAYGVGTWQAGCFFTKSWRGEAFHDLRVHSAVGLFLFN